MTGLNVEGLLGKRNGKGGQRTRGGSTETTETWRSGGKEVGSFSLKGGA